MVHSPSPGVSAMVTMGTSTRRLSPSPSLPQQPLSKRDKKRSQIDNKVKEIEAARHANRDATLRAKLNALSRDIHYINRADLYQNQPLGDWPDDMMTEVASAAASSAGDPEITKVPLGKNAAQFVDQVNDAMEERDASLTNVHLRFKKQLEYFKMEYDFAVEVADAEEQALKAISRKNIREGVQKKKKALQAEKDSLDSADSSAILNSSGFTIANPASPGGAYSNRKTRHGRHLRQDQDTLESVETSKRKRKAPADHDHDSPGPGYRLLSGINASVWDKAGSSVDADQIGEIPVDRRFKPNELASSIKQAYTSVAEAWAGKRPKAAGKGLNGMGSSTNGDLHNLGHRIHNQLDGEDSQDEPTSLIAPAMDRAGSHATRSTRNIQIEVTVPRDSYDSLRNPDRVYGLAVMDALGVRSHKSNNNKDLEAPLTSSLTTQEITEDRAYFEQLLAEDTY